jgi:hypothetical protein
MLMLLVLSAILGWDILGNSKKATIDRLICQLACAGIASGRLSIGLGVYL